MINEAQIELLRAVEELWNLYPDYRLGQMISNYTFLARTGQFEDVYDCEDNELLKTITESIRNRKRTLAERATSEAKVS